LSEPQIELERTRTDWPAGTAEEQPPEAAPEEVLGEWEEEAPPVPLDQARSLLTGPLPAGLGEVLVTDIWMRPAPKEPKRKRRGRKQKLDWFEQIRSVDLPRKVEETPVDPQRAWEERQELRELGLLREHPAMRYDARTEQYWRQVSDARDKAKNAILDPYTDFVISFADVDHARLADYREGIGEYGRRGDALLELGRGYLVIGRLKSARSLFAAAVRADPHNPRAWWHLGIAHLFARANRKAAWALENAENELPGDMRYELALATARFHLRDYAGAEELFRRQAGDHGLRATARSMLGCSLRMQGKWDDARIELGFLREARGGDWPAMAKQCLECVERGEQKEAGILRVRRRSRNVLKLLGGLAAGGGWVGYALAEKLFEKEPLWAAIPLFGLAALLVRGLHGISGRETSGEFGNAEQGLPCWQTTSWMRPRRLEF